MTTFKVVLLDIDGTLLLSNDAHAQAFVEAAESVGLPADFVAVRRLVGMGSDKLIPEAFGIDAQSDVGKKLDKEKSRIFRSNIPSLQPAPGARELLTRLRTEGIHLVVATSAGKDDVSLLLKQARVRDLIEETTSSDDAESSKPEPDIIQAALRKSHSDSREAVMIGDTPYDVEAARRAGVPILSVRCGGFWEDADFRGSLSIFDDPADILAHLGAVQRKWSEHTNRRPMTNRTNTNDATPSGVLVTAATSIGKVAGKLVGLVRKKAGSDVAKTTRRSSAKRVQTSAKKKATRKKTGMSRKTRSTGKSSTPRKG